MSMKVTPESYPEIIEKYNTEGKAAAYDFIRNHYGIKNPTCVMKRIKQDAGISYNPESDEFDTVTLKEDGLFMGLDDLCSHRVVKTEMQGSDHNRGQALEKLVHSLISDRLLEISRYVTLDPVSRRILVDQTSMQADGYTVCVC